MSRLEKPTLTDYDRLEKLWIEGFHDSREYFRFFADRGIQYADVFISEKQGIIASALYLFPVECLCKGEKLYGRYVYGVATLPQFRGQNLASSLLFEAEQYILEQGGQFALLVPSVPSLFSYYQRLGYSTFSRFKSLQFSKKELESLPLKNNIVISPCERTEFLHMRRILLSDYPCNIQFFDDFMEYVYDEAVFSESSTIKITSDYGQGLAIYYKIEDTLLISELLYKDLQLEDIIKAICMHFKASACEATLPVSTECGNVMTNITDFSMIKPLVSVNDMPNTFLMDLVKNTNNAYTPYFNFAMN